MEPNMIFVVIAAMVLAVHFSSISSEEVTHMPHVKDVELAPEVMEALNGEKLDEPECYEDYEKAMAGIFMHLGSKLKYNGLHMTTLKICDSCYIKTNEDMTVNRTTYAVYRLCKDSVVVEVWMRFPTIFSTCSECFLTNDRGEKHSGGMSLVWKNPLIRVVAQDIYFMDLHTLGIITSNVNERKRLFNGTNINKENIDVTCQGDHVFNKVCKKAHKTGELDSVMHAVGEHIFNFDKLHFPDLDDHFRNLSRDAVITAFACYPMTE